MEKIKVSVAVPIYNTARHLTVMFDSLINQTMDSSDFEIICVNDCSTDNSKEVVEKYSRIMSNVVLINRAENSGGPSIPRNDAIAAARGEYIHFLDSDDFLGEEALERLYHAAQQNQSDVIFGKYIGVNGRPVPDAMFKKGNRLKADIIADDLVYSLAPHKMFKRSFLKEYGYKFNPEALIAEDQLFVMQCYVAANVITVLADYDYYFVVARGNESLTEKMFPGREFFFVYNKIMEFLNEFMDDEHYKKRIKIAFFNRIIKMKRGWRDHLLTTRTTHEQKIEWLNETKKFIDTHLDDELIQSLDTQYHYFLEAVKENDIQKLATVHL